MGWEAAASGALKEVLRGVPSALFGFFGQLVKPEGSRTSAPAPVCPAAEEVARVCLEECSKANSLQLDLATLVLVVVVFGSGVAVGCVSCLCCCRDGDGYAAPRGARRGVLQ